MVHNMTNGRSLKKNQSRKHQFATKQSLHIHDNDFVTQLFCQTMETNFSFFFCFSTVECMHSFISLSLKAFLTAALISGSSKRRRLFAIHFLFDVNNRKLSRQLLLTGNFSWMAVDFISKLLRLFKFHLSFWKASMKEEQQ